jgi:pyruvate/2-oxoacid:ferredoxin oxidoreductase beta subunit
MCIPSDETMNTMIQEAMKDLTRADMEQVLVTVLTQQMGMGEESVAEYLKSMSDEDVTKTYTQIISEQMKAQYATQIMTELGTMTEEQLAVEAGYWFNFRYNPTLAGEGKDAFILDSKEPKGDYQEFLAGENRYAALKKMNPERAAELFAQSEQDSKDRYAHLLKLVNLYKGE